MTLDEYLRHPGLSAGSLSRYIAGGCDIWKHERDTGITHEVNDDNLGTIVHAMTLEAKSPEDICAVWTGGLTTKGEPTTSKNSKAYADFCDAAKADGKLVCDAETVATARAMLRALLAPVGDKPSQAAPLLFHLDGTPEHTMIWTERGHSAKARADRMLFGPRIMVELKTTFATTLEAHRKQAFELGYHHKADWYRRAYLGTKGEPLEQFLFVTVSKTPTHPVWVWSVAPDGETVATAEIDWALDDIARRTDSGDWTQETSKQVSYLTIPTWKISDIGRKALEAT